MLNLHGPGTVSQEVVFESHEDKIHINTTSKILIEVWKGKDGNVEENVALDEASKAFIYVFLK